MAKGSKYVAGSRAFWPRKRAKRIYPKAKKNRIKEAKPVAFAGYKAGMTQVIFNENRKSKTSSGMDVARAVTVLDCPPLAVVGVRAYKQTRDGLKAANLVWAEKISKDLKRKTALPKKTAGDLGKMEKKLDNFSEIRLIVHTKPKDSGLGKKRPELFELPLGGKVTKQWEYAKEKFGQELDVSDVFEEGEYIDVNSVSKGKGVQGPVKRFGVTIRPRKHEKKRRHIGNIGSVGVARVLPGAVAMAGQLGQQTRTEWNKRILKIGKDGLEPEGGFLNYGKVPGNYILLEGSVPGPKKRLIMLSVGRRSDKKEPAEIKNVISASQN